MQDENKVEYVTNKIKVSNSAKFVYLDGLTGKIYKILPIIEKEGYDIAGVYIWGLLNDISSANDIIFDGEIIELIPKLNSIKFNNLGFKESRKIIFECINLVSKFKEKHCIKIEKAG